MFVWSAKSFDFSQTFFLRLHNLALPSSVVPSVCLEESEIVEGDARAAAIGHDSTQPLADDRSRSSEVEEGHVLAANGGDTTAKA